MAKLKFFSMNVNSDRRIENEDDKNTWHLARAFPEYRFEHRWPILKELLDAQINKGVELFALQELDDQSKVIIGKYLKSEGFTIQFSRYNLDEGPYTFSYLFAYKADKVDLIEKKSIHFTVDRKPTENAKRLQMTMEEKKERHFGLEFDRSAQLLKLDLKENGIITIVNVHPGLTNEHRLAAMKILIEELLKEGRVILVGDFNSFDMNQAKSSIFKEQLEILTDNNYSWITDFLEYSGLMSTFLTYPYDIARFISKTQFQELDRIKSENGTGEQIRDFFNRVIKENGIEFLSTCLDHVLSKGINKENFKVKTLTSYKGSIFKPSKYEGDKSKFEEDYRKDITTQKDPVTPSDHFGVKFSVRL